MVNKEINKSIVSLVISFLKTVSNSSNITVSDNFAAEAAKELETLYSLAILVNLLQLSFFTAVTTCIGELQINIRIVCLHLAVRVFIAFCVFYWAVFVWLRLVALRGTSVVVSVWFLISFYFMEGSWWVWVTSSTAIVGCWLAREPRLCKLPSFNSSSRVARQTLYIHHSTCLRLERDVRN